MAMKNKGFGALHMLARHSVSALALSVIAAPAFAQSAENTETVVVTGSRLVTNGNQAPTPVTVVSTDQLQLAAPRSLADGLLQLPAFSGSASIQNQSTGTTGSNGATNLNLRSLGPERTLVLLDGRRIPSNNFSGSVDIMQLPQPLVQRVDIVTGGASAAYGSDAVAGVVNFILNTKYEGFKAEVQGGMSEYADNTNYKISLTAGQSFLGGRLHLVASLLDYYSAGVTDARDREWTPRMRAIITNPGATAATATATNPQQLVVVGGVASNAAAGGLVTGSNGSVGCTGPAPGSQANPSLANPSLKGCAASAMFKGTTFNPDGSPRPFQYGDMLTGTTMRGGEGVADNPNLDLTLQPAQRSDQIFTHLTYDLDDDNSVFLQIAGSANHIRYRSLPTFELSSTAFTIFADNAYLPATVAQAMASSGTRALIIGRDSADLAIPTMQENTNTGVVTVGADGKLPFGSTWTYHAYGQMGRNFASYKTVNDPISDNLYAASDAVLNPANGQIVCRSVLNGSVSGADPGCVPLNIFGPGNASPKALDYITGTAIQRVLLGQDVLEGSASGELFDLPAGAVSLAFGAGYRAERGNQTTDPRSQEIRTGIGLPGFPTGGIPGFASGIANSLGGFERTNPQPTHGSYNVTEIFSEVEVPIVKDVSWANLLTVNAAARYVDYSISGGVEPWKLGLVWEVNDWLRLRASRSTDIRAPNLGELFKGSSQGTSAVTDTPRGSTAIENVLTGSVGNSGLVPESSNTWTVGGVFTPEFFLPGFSFTIDYYSISITKAISTLSAQQELDQCAAGAQQECSFIQRNGSGGLARVLLPYFNAASRLTKGEDIEIDYSTNLADWDMGLDGTLTTRLIANHLDRFETNVLNGNPLEFAGSLNNNTPSWRGVLQASYNLDAWSVFVQERVIGGGKYDRSKSPAQLGGNQQGSVYYTDMTMRYDVTDKAQVYLTINNLFDRDPPGYPSTLISGPNFSNRTLYDLIGRTFTAGVRFNTD
jgi:outer membrane receptor protein involved in Fe transport